MPPAGTLARPFEGIAYGLLGLPLAFVALPLYVHLPHLYARDYGVPLVLLGAVLLAARLLDAVIDPLLGRWVDRLYARSHRPVLAAGGAAGVGLVAGLVALFVPWSGATASTPRLMVWMSTALLLTYASYSLLAIVHQAWGTRLGGDDAQRSRIVAWREGFGIVGVVLASVLPGLGGLPVMLGVFAAAVVLGGVAWTRAPVPPRPTPTATAEPVHGPPALMHPWRRARFRPLAGVFALNGIASAVSATLVLFFMQDRLGAARAHEPLFLGTYFVCAALSIPAWLQAVRRWGLARSWLLGMALAIAAFVWTLGLGHGDSTAFLVICIGAGLALGADLVLPGALLAGVIDAHGDRGRFDGAYLGWWNFITKANLALAAGLALPLLGLLGYTPGHPDAHGLRALSWVYAGVPCALKALAASVLWWTFVRRHAWKEAHA